MQTQTQTSVQTPCRTNIQTYKMLLRPLLLLVLATEAAHRTQFRTCATSPFCSRYRAFAKRQSNETPSPLPGWRVSDASQNATSLNLRLVNAGAGDAAIEKRNLQAVFRVTRTGALRLQIDEVGADVVSPRYRVPDEDVLINFERVLAPLNEVEIGKDRTRVSWVAEAPAVPFRHEQKLEGAQMQAVVKHAPFGVQVYRNGKLQLELNGRNLMNFEASRTKKDDAPAAHTLDATGVDNQSLWSYYFGGHEDKITQGPMAVGMDVDFCNSENYASV